MNKEEYKRRLKQVELGMSKKDFWALFPEAEQRGAKKYPKGAVEVLAVNWSYYSFTPTGALRALRLAMPRPSRRSGRTAARE